MPTVTKLCFFYRINDEAKREDETSPSETFRYQSITGGTGRYTGDKEKVTSLCVGLHRVTFHSVTKVHFHLHQGVFVGLVGSLIQKRELAEYSSVS